MPRVDTVTEQLPYRTPVKVSTVLGDFTGKIVGVFTTSQAVIGWGYMVEIDNPDDDWLYPTLPVFEINLEVIEEEEPEEEESNDDYCMRMMGR